LLSPGPSLRLRACVALPSGVGAQIEELLQLLHAELSLLAGGRQIDQTGAERWRIETRLDRSIVHAHRRDVPVALQLLEQLVDQSAHLQHRHAAEVAHQEDYFVVGCEVHIPAILVGLVEEILEVRGDEGCR